MAPGSAGNDGQLSPISCWSTTSGWKRVQLPTAAPTGPAPAPTDRRTAGNSAVADYGAVGSSENHLFVEPQVQVRAPVASTRQTQPCGVVPLTGSVPMHSSHSVAHGVFLSVVVVPSGVAHSGAVGAPMKVGGRGQGQAEKAPPEQVQVLVPIPANPHATEQSCVQSAPTLASTVLQVGSGDGGVTSSTKSTLTFTLPLRRMVRVTLPTTPATTVVATASATHVGSEAAVTPAHVLANACPLNVSAPSGNPFILSTVDAPGVTSKLRTTARVPSAWI